MSRIEAFLRVFLRRKINMKPGAATRLALAALLLSGAVLAQDIPLTDWEVPGDGLSKLAVVQPTVFAPVSPPCRLDDSRLSSGGAGPIPASGTRDYDFIPSGGIGCGALPANVVALSVFVTVVGPSGSGFLYAFPTGSPPGSPTSIVNYNAGELKNAAAIIPVNSGTGAFTLGVGGNGTDVIIDLNGIFYTTLNTPHQLSIVANAFGEGAISGQNTSTVFASSGVAGSVNGGATYGVFGEAGSASASGAAGVFGVNFSNAVNSFGVFGQLGNSASLGALSAGVRGLVSATGPNPGNGVWGSNAGGGTGVAGTSAGGFGVYAESATNTGIFGQSSATVGIHGRVNNTGFGSSGVLGQTETWNPGFGPQIGAGVRGDSFSGYGVLGVSFLTGNAAVAGIKTGEVGGAGPFSAAYLGFSNSTGLFVIDDIVATGTKFFVEPHPTDPSRVIKFISLEGNEPGTYFRGKGKFERGIARIAVPEDFRIVTDPEGLSIQVTPIGEMATVAVVRVGLDEIIVKASRNVEFYYTVNGIRKATKDAPILGENEFFVPESASATLPPWVTDEAKARLISNGTYNADGTVNLETAKKLGWDKIWTKLKPE